MFGISTFCLHAEPLDTALEKISQVKDYIEVMDEGLHYLDSAEPLTSYSGKFSIHVPCHGINVNQRTKDFVLSKDPGYPVILSNILLPFLAQ